MDCARVAVDWTVNMNFLFLCSHDLMSIRCKVDHEVTRRHDEGTLKKILEILETQPINSDLKTMG
jgi:hypothetical protein